MAFVIPSSRTLNFLIFAICVMTIGIVLYMEHVMLLSPCGLCISQRVFVILCGLVCLVSAIHNPAPKLQRTYAYIAAAMCPIGSYFAIRQIWLQHLPEDEVPACGPGFTYIMENFPFVELLSFLLVGDGNCAEVQFQILGFITIPVMALMAFVILFCACLFIAFRKPKGDILL